MLLNNLMFWMMVVEAVICLMLTLPFGQWLSYTMMSFLMKYLDDKNSPVNTMATIVLALVAILFLSNVSTVYKHHL
ncbi:unnamed protein product [Peronospora belbahrii]|uniref:BAP29/BAP31 transmembrane domain-containing protein n=1 Tax=Peronospora belbahrii TaxID=622444 RepID=A0ABN8CR29_9STRA|nr:unnamed protein product [Peronospora belbahrii]